MTTPVYILLNQFQVLESEGDSLEIVAVYLSESKAQDHLDEVAEATRGHWTENHTVYNADDPNLEYDSYYIESYEAN